MLCVNLPSQLLIVFGEGRANKCVGPSGNTLGSLKLNAISNTRERYSMIQVGALRFPDPAIFLKDSLAVLIIFRHTSADEPAIAFPRMAKLHADARGAKCTLHLILRKTIFPYKSMTDHAVCNRLDRFPIEAYNNGLAGDVCCDTYYANVGQVTRALGLSSVGYCHDVGVYTDAGALAECFEAFRGFVLAEHTIVVCHYVSIPLGSDAVCSVAHTLFL